MKRLHVIVHGRVQGVFFRAHTREKASSLGLKGFVRNMPDGDVEVVAEGHENKLKELHAWLSGGPEIARVDKIEAEYSKAKNEFESFEVRY